MQPLRLPPSSTLFPYTTLFRSQIGIGAGLLAELVEFTLPGLADVLRVSPARHLRVEVPHEPVGIQDRRPVGRPPDRKSTRLNSSHGYISYAVFCLKKNTATNDT